MRSAIVPQNGRANDVILLVENDESMHLSANGYALDISLNALRKRLYYLTGGGDPVFGILFAPSVARVMHGVRLVTFFDNVSQTVNEQAFESARAEI